MPLEVVTELPAAPMDPAPPPEEPPLPPELPAVVVGSMRDDSSDPPQASTSDNTATSDHPKSDAKLLISSPQ
jgi:hypothetical protein